MKKFILRFSSNSCTLLCFVVDVVALNAELVAAVPDITELVVVAPNVKLSVEALDGELVVVELAVTIEVVVLVAEPITSAPDRTLEAVAFGGEFLVELV